MKKAVEYVRVSTQDQAERGSSLDGQQAINSRFAQSQDIDIIHSFVERGESARTLKRTELQNLMQYIVKNDKEVDYLIVWRLDRLSRSVYDTISLMQFFENHGVQVLSATESNEQNPETKMLRNITQSVAEYESDLKSLRITAIMKEEMKNGRYIFYPPTGYSFQMVDGKKTIIPNKDAEPIKQAFEDYASGTFSLEDIRRKIRRSGISLSKESIRRILKNKLYMGYIEMSWNMGQPIKGIHEPIISEELFYRVQETLKLKRPTFGDEGKVSADFALKMFVKCDQCDRYMTPYLATGRGGKKYAYYKCNKCNLNIKKEVMENGFTEMLNRLSPTEDTLEEFKDIIINIWDQRQKSKEKKIRQLKEAISKTESRMRKLTDLLLDGVILDHVYTNKHSELANEAEELKIELSKINRKIDHERIEKSVKFSVDVLKNIETVYRSVSIKEKRNFQSFIFPKGVTYGKEGYRTTATCSIFNVLSNNLTLTGTDGGAENRKIETDNLIRELLMFYKLSKMVKEQNR